MDDNGWIVLVAFPQPPYHSWAGAGLQRAEDNMGESGCKKNRTSDHREIFNPYPGEQEGQLTVADSRRAGRCLRIHTCVFLSQAKIAGSGAESAGS